VGCALEEGKESVKSEVSKLRGTRGKYRFIDAHKSVVIPPEEGKVSEAGLGVSDKAPNLE
jgi:hypothetical protein